MAGHVYMLNFPFVVNISETLQCLSSCRPWAHLHASVSHQDHPNTAEKQNKFTSDCISERELSFFLSSVFSSSSLLLLATVPQKWHMCVEWLFRRDSSHIFFSTRGAPQQTGVHLLYLFQTPCHTHTEHKPYTLLSAEPVYVYAFECWGGPRSPGNQ